ncbi:MAG: hypothetical protein FWH10_06730 [Oscillospiraceae bacterium]|nr:hypothetical protein [Oscillospiraceae bacterium]
MKNILKYAAYKIFVGLILAVVMVYSIFQYWKTMGSLIETERADLEVRRSVTEIYGYIFRNEEIIYSSGGNSVNYLTDNGGKVGRNQRIARIHHTFSDLSAREEINETDKRLYILNASNINLDFVNSNISGIERIDADSNAVYTEMMKNISSGKIRDAGKNRDELLIMLNKKQLINGTLSSGIFDNLIAEADEKKRTLTQSASGSGAGASDVYSNRAGIFYHTADGYENYFTGDSVKTLDFEKFGELMEKEPDVNILNGALGKTAYDFNWYLVCKTEKSSAADFTAGRTYDIVYPFSYNKSIPSVLTRRIDGADLNSGEAILVFEASSIPVDFDFSRKQTIQIVRSEVSGIKVPVEALHIVTGEDGETSEGVYVQRGNRIVFRELPASERLGMFDGYYLYLEPSKRPETGGGQLLLYENIVISGKDLYDGKVTD